MCCLFVFCLSKHHMLDLRLICVRCCRSTPQRSANEVYNLQTSFQSTAAEDGKTAVVIVDDRSKETARKKKRKRKVARKKMGEKSFKRMRSKQ